MKRINFISDIKNPSQIYPHDAITNANIRIYIDKVLTGGVQELILSMDLKYGYFKAYVRKIRLQPGTNQAVTNLNVALNEDMIVYDEINKDLSPDALILDHIEDDGKNKHFYLRTIIIP